MSSRILLLAALLPLLGACTGGAVSNSSPYDLADKYVDSTGHPLPGWAYMRDAATMGEGE